MKKILCAMGLVLCTGSMAASQEVHELKVASFVTPMHAMSKWIEQWAAGLEEQSGGRLKFTILAGAQMGPPPAYYDLAANGVADITWVLHGSTPGRFPLTEISNMPFIFCSAIQADKVLNMPELLAYFEPEHRGVKLLELFMHPPGHIMMKGGAVLSSDDLAGKALRPASQPVGRFIADMGGKPVGLPPTELAEALQKGVIDGTMIDYGGAAFAYQLGPFLTDITELYAYSVSFALVMNPDSYAGLPEDLQKMIDDSMADVSDPIGQAWDGLDQAAKAVLTKEGVKIHKMADEDVAEVRAIADKLTASYIEELDGKGLPGSDVLKAIQDGVEKVGAIGPGCQ